MFWVSPAVLKEMEENPEKYALRLKEGSIEFLLIKVQGDPLKDLQERMGHVISMCINEIYISHIISNIIYGYYFFWQTDNPSDLQQKRRRLVSQLMARFPYEIAIVHGGRHGLSGNFGSRQKFQYTAVFKGFNECLKKILDIPSGNQIEI